MMLGYEGLFILDMISLTLGQKVHEPATVNTSNVHSEM